MEKYERVMLMRQVLCMGVKIVFDSTYESERRDLMYKSYQNNIDRNGNVRQNSQIQRQATFPRLKDRMLYEEKGERRLIMNLIVFLYNYRASVVGLNQIQSVYMPWLERSANGFIDG
jgi:hypothetical protein